MCGLECLRVGFELKKITSVLVLPRVGLFVGSDENNAAGYRLRQNISASGMIR